MITDDAINGATGTIPLRSSSVRRAVEHASRIPRHRNSRSFVQFLYNRDESSNRAEKPAKRGPGKFTAAEIHAGGVRFRWAHRISRTVLLIG